MFSRIFAVFNFQITGPPQLQLSAGWGATANLQVQSSLRAHGQGFNYRPFRQNRCGPVPVYLSGLVGNQSVPVEFKFEFKFRSTTDSYRYTGRLDRYTGRLDRYNW